MDGRQWRVTAEFDYHVGAPDGVTVVKVAPGFITDFASIPRVLWGLLAPTGWYGKAAVIHDACYRRGSIDGVAITRKYADDVLAECMRVLTAYALLDHGTRRGELKEILDHMVIYEGVRLGGWVAWNAYRRRKVVRWV